MANPEHLDILKQGAKAWNLWRKEHADIEPDLSGTDLSGANFRAANFRAANLSRTNFRAANLIFADFSDANLNHANLSAADLSRVFLVRADLSHACLSHVNFSGADLSDANLSAADLSDANLSGANFGKDAHLGGPYLGRANLNGASLNGANLNGASLEIKDLRNTTVRNANLSGHNLNNMDFSRMDLSGANLNETSLIKTNFSHTNLTGCSIYGVAAWDIQIDEQTIQKNLTITPPHQPTITVDNLKIAQFIYLLLNNAEIREVIDTITSKVVLILGRFTPERKAVLDALRDKLRDYDLLPVLFDFDPPKNQDLTETVSTLAHLARFVIVDLTDPSSAPHEMATIASQCIRPIKPIISNDLIIKDGKEVEQWREYAMFRDLRRRYHWILDTFRYQDVPHLIASLEDYIIKPIEEKINHWEPEKEKIKEQEEEIRKLKEELEALKRRR